jgi:amino acid adenylation domain-containing protein
MKPHKKNIESIDALSPLQEGMVFHTLYAPNSGVYFEQLSCTLQGNLNRHAFKQAWQKVMERHPVLRMLVIWKKGTKPLQLVRKQVQLPWTEQDWRDCSLTDCQARLASFLKADREQGFILDQAPLMRCALIQVTEDSYYFVWSHHHLLMDGWCLPIILKEVFTFYQAFCQGQVLHLPTPRPYRDYLAWLQKQDISKAKAFWQQQLQGFTTPTPFQIDKHSEGSHQELTQEHYQEQTIHLSNSVTAALQALVRTHHLTMNTLVQGAWALLLSRYSGFENVVFGVTVSGRPPSLTGVETMVGLFINTLPIRVFISPESQVLPWLQQLQATQVECETYSYTSLVDIQAWSEVPTGVPLFESLLVFENYPIDQSLEAEKIAGLAVHDIQSFDKTNYPLTLEATVNGDKLELTILYTANRFEADAISRMIGHLKTLLEGMIIQPETRQLRDIPLLTVAEQQQFLAWNDTAKNYPLDKTFIKLFDEQVEKTPERIAVVFENQQLTYQALNTKANQLAHYLINIQADTDNGSLITDNCLVGIYLERSLSMLISILGILKTGSAYLPLDPLYPATRLRLILKEAQVPIVLTQENLREKLSTTSARLVCLETETDTLSQYRFDNPDCLVKPEHLAYVIYTSGSTGMPKGVMIEHQGMLNHIYAKIDDLGLREQDIVVQNAPLTFDISVWQLLAALLLGGRIDIFNQETARQPVQLLQRVVQQQITILEMVPSLLRAILEEIKRTENRPNLSTLRWLILTGEALPPQLCTEWLAVYPTIPLFNAYGPTECSDDVAHYPIEKPPAPNVNQMPIGKPVSNTQLYILDDRLQPLPVGIAGELYVGGVGVGRGYLNAPEKTTDAFIKAPAWLNQSTETRLYKTGDLARYLPDGHIEYLGRIDNQVKIRGFRIELGEIEAVLAQHPSVKANAVIVQETSKTNKRLIAYLVLHQEQVIENTALRDFLRERLPDYMVPSAWVTVEALPLTANGKIDRKLLVTWANNNELVGWVERSETHHVAPRTPEEELLAGIWAEVLGVPRVGIHDNFFELGGHSLLATQVMSRIRDAFEIELPLRELFESPTIAGLSQYLNTTRRETALPPITQVNRSESLPLSFAQQRLWFLNQLEGPSATYNIPAALRLDGTFHQNALALSLQTLVQRHESLRTVFPTINGKPVVQLSDISYQLLVINYQEIPVSEQEAEVQRLIDEDAQLPFDLETGPLFRTTLLQLEATSHILLLNMHHIISDGWSIDVLVQELGVLYQAFSQNQPSPLSPLPIQYVDFAHWQRQWLTGEVLKQQVVYWKQKLAGIPALLELPTDYPRPPVQRFQGASLPITISPEVTQKLKRLSQQSGCTLFMVLWSAFATLLSRYSGQMDIVIGSPIAGRTQSQTESLIGFFVNTLVLRLNLSDNPTFDKVLRQARQVALEAYSYQDIPFEQLVEELNPERNLSYSPLFQVMLVLQNTLTSDLELSELSLTQLSSEHTTAKFDLLLSMGETEDSLVGALEYSTDLFKTATIERLLEHFKILLANLVINPRQSIHELPLLTKAEQQQFLDWNKTSVDYPQNQTLVYLFQAQVEKTPNNIAVVFEDKSLTYQQLNQQANQLAHYLLNLKTDTENGSLLTGNCLVGICLERSLLIGIGILGIFKAGAAYLPLDPAYPAARLAFILDNAAVKVLLSQTSLAEKLSDTQAQVVYLDTTAKTWSQYSSDNPNYQVKPDDLAYVIYTSGSTGTPKGAMIEHQGMLNHISAKIDDLGMTATDIVAQNAPLTFDISVWQWLAAILLGGQVCLVNEETARQPLLLLQAVVQQRVTILEIVPSLLRAILEEITRTEAHPNLSQLRWLILTGEALPPKLCVQWLAIYPNIPMFNAYGPTECSDDVTHYAIEQPPASEVNQLPIGKPINNMRLYLLDAYQERVPVGIAGELYVAGIGVGRGYLNAPDKTVDAFIQAPAWLRQQGETRLYKTGDLARYLPDGHIEYLGRIDNQVKIRGFRIELGEIEAMLGQHPLVKENAVIVHETKSPLGETLGVSKRLVAFLVAHQGQAVDSEQCRQFLRERLPDYMVPSVWVTLETLPLTANGKIDRKTLEKFTIHNSQFTIHNYSPPRTPEEELLAGIWAEVLGIPQIGIHDNFFESGGHSLLATQVMSRIRDSFDIELPLRELFEAPTVAGLSTRLNTARRDSVLPPITPINRLESLPLSFAQQRLWFLNQLEGPSATYNIAAALRLDGPLHQTALAQSLQTLVERHENLRAVFPTINGKPIVQLSVNNYQLSVISLPDLPQSALDIEVLRLINEDAQQAFDLENGPLFRATLLQLGMDSHALLLNMHHIISDGWSLGVLVREWGMLYEAFSQNQASPLPPLPIQYVDFAHWQRQWLTGEVLEQQLAYWKQQLADVPTLLELPTDYPRPPVQRFQGASLPIAIPLELTAQLKQLSQQTGTTLFMLLWSAFATLLSRYSGQTDIAIGSPIANRTLSQTEFLIGFFVNTLVLRLDLSDNPPFENVLRQARRVALEAYTHQDIPFEQLVEELNPERNLSNSPLFQVMFALQNVPMSDLELSGLQITPLESENKVAQFDLSLALEETTDGLVGELEYDTDLFTATFIERMIGHLLMLLGGLATNPQQVIGQLPLLTEAEQQQFLVWNDTATDYPRDKTIVDLFEAQVDKTPDAIAVAFENQSVTYHQLNQKANQIAHYLLNLKTETHNGSLFTDNCLVGICLERSLEMISSVLGVLKAGAAYLPLDYSYPPARLAFMVEDAQIAVLLTHSHLKEKLPSTRVQMLYLDTKFETLSHWQTTNPLSKAWPESLAYVIYTSGSTGQSKGVKIAHQNLVNVYYAWEKAYQLPTTITTHLQMANFSFDVFTGDWVRALCSGAKLVLCPQEVLLNPEQLWQLMRQEKIDCGEFVPAVLRNLLPYLQKMAQPLDFMKLFIVGSDSWFMQEYQAVRKICGPSTRLISSYGVTEATIDSTYFESTQTQVYGSVNSLVPIGRPFANTQIYLLDRYQNLVPIGVPGELHIGGAGLAQGYLNRPELTTAKFIQNPLSEDKKDRLYKTGDLARYLPDGNIEYLSRLDNQVKIRGFRIELGEIEAVLEQHPLVQENAVVVHETEETGKRLVAYLVLQPEQIIENIELQAFLKQRLPIYMVPSSFVVLETMPLTPNGKIDRLTLSRLSVENDRLSEQTLNAPGTPEEELLTGIWLDVLHIKQIGIHDNFFESGGHSLLATQVVSRIRDSFEVELPLRDLFESPTIAALSTRLNAARQKSPLPPITPVDRSKPLQLSFAQQRLWFLNQLEGPSATYNMPAALRLEGLLSQKALAQSLQALVQRHESLRTAFPTIDGNPLVQISEKPFQLDMLDLRALLQQEQTTEIQYLIEKDAVCPFDLESGPLFRATLLQLGADSHILLLNMHHIISDGWSIDVLIYEWNTLYEAFSQGKPSPLSPLPIQYVDFAHWQRQWLTGEVLEQQLAYWKQQLVGCPALLELPTDKPRPPVQSFQGTHLQFSLSPELTTQLKHLSQRTNTTLFMVLWSAFATLLSRYSGQSDIVTGSPIAGRSQGQTESLIGFFVNTLVLRLDLSDNPQFEKVLQQARRVALEAYTHQDIPFEQLVEELNPARNLSHTPLFQVMFVLQNTSIAAESELSTELNVSVLETESVVAKFDLTLSIEDSELGLVGEFEYNTDLFESATIERMIGHWQTLLTGLVANPQQPIHQLPLLTETEQQQLLAWNETATDYPHDKTIIDLFDEQVDKTPAAIAVVFENHSVTYQQLNAKANQLAHYLHHLGVKPDVLVGICVERSLDMIIGLLGIFKAGGAYLPLDPVYPEARLAFMLEDAKVPILLTQSSLTDKLPQTTATILCLDAETKTLSQLSKENPVNQLKPEHLAYVIYTSGSTGNPKGVLIAHQGLCNLAKAQIQLFDVQSGSNILQFASLSFDASIWEIVMALGSGAQLCLAKQNDLLPGPNLVQLLRQHAISHVTLPPTALAVLPIKDGLNLQCLIVAGESCSPDLAVPWSKSSRFFNAYGPTEGTVCATVFENLADSPSTLPIGRPIANIQTYILDHYLQPLPVGIPGELHIGGVGLARGYLNRPDLTAEKFINNPFSDDPDARLYKTGDLARYLPDGNIEYLGRIDNQVKIRGFRIELGEIEAALGQYPSVQENAVIVHESSQTGKRLIAYLVPRPEKLIETTALRSFLTERLPDYMIPSVWVILEALPLTLNGKIDRKVLEQFTINDSPFTIDNYSPPRTPEEELLAGIWANILNVPRVGAYDNFFELGGHSLLATQVMSRIRDTFAVELPVRELFESPTITTLTTRINTARQKSPLPPITPINREEPLPLSFAQQRLWFLNQLEGPSATYNIAMALRIKGTLHQDALAQSLQTLVQRHENLRTAFPTVNGAPTIQLSIISYQLSVINLLDLPLSEQEVEVQNLINEDAQRSFDLETGPLFRATLLHTAHDSYILLLNMHHIISDGWSLGVLVQELGALYEAFSQGKPSPLPQLPIQYVDFAYWQRQWLAGKVLEQQLAYWKQQLAGVPTLLELPTDYPRPPVQRFQGASLPISLSPELTAQLKSLSQQMGATLFMTLWAAFAILLSRYSQQRDIVIGSPIANRTHSQTESLIGFFVNTLVLRLDLSNNPSFEHLLQQARRVALEAYNYQDIPFEQLVEELHPERSLSHSPLFQVMFTLQNAPISELALADLKIEPLAMESVNAKFDLTLSLEETTEGLVGELDYNLDLFKIATIERMRGHLETLLTSLVSHPQQSIYELPLLTKAEQQQLLAWNHTTTDFPRNKTLVSLFEEQAAKTPETIAVVFEGRSLTYQALNSKANQLAYYLQSLGVKPEELVGIFLERCLEMLISLLGVLKAGGAYLPLAPDYPTARLAFMLEDAQLPIVLTQSGLIDRLPKTIATKVCLDIEAATLSRFHTGNLNIEIYPWHLAYVIYTSGSTGQPKGAMNPHQGICNRLLWMQKTFQLTSTDCVLQKAPFSFDVSVWEFFWPLLAGARLVIAKPGGHKDSDYLIQLMIQQTITTIQAVPSLLQVLVTEPDFKNCCSLKRVFCGGEALSFELQQRFFARLPATVELHNFYGPTETAVGVTHWACQRQSDLTQVPIGRPTANIQIYILDAYLQAVPIGVPGELHIGGVALGRGYLYRPDLTASKFIANPFGDKPGSRLYKTGDLVRYLPDGSIDYLGRIDNQVKVRGFRIELGEIETVLRQHPAVQENTVIVHEASGTGQRLVAYLVASPETILNTTELPAFLTERLPNYMVPSSFITLETLPLTPNGKIDRRALARLSLDNDSLLNKNYIAPRDLLELQLIHIWENILEVRPIGIHDNFFDLGGHSLLAVRLMAQIKQQLETHLPLASLFQGATIEQLAVLIRQQTNHTQTPQWSPLVVIQSNGAKPPLFCVHPTGGNVLCYFDLAQSLGTEQPVYGLQAIGLEAGQVPYTQVEEMANFYLNALQTVQPQGPYRLAGWSFGGLVAYEMARQLQTQGWQVSLLALLDTVVPSVLVKQTESKDEAEFLVDLLADEGIALSLEHLRQLNPDEQLAYAIEQGQQAGQFLPEVDLAQAQRFLQLYKTNSQAARQYQPQPYQGKVTLFQASETPVDLSLESGLGWETLATDGLEIIQVPGDHQELVESKEVAEQLKIRLENTLMHLEHEGKEKNT